MEARLLGPGFFAEVRGVGLADVADRDDAYAFVRAAFEEHSVLLFRGQPITDELQVAYSKRFGPLEVAKVASLGEGTPFSILTDIDRATGKLVPPDHKDALPPVRWPMRWCNPVNGRDALYIASHTCAIEGMPREEALALLDELIVLATAPGCTYLHAWAPGDVIMWDNRATVHRGRPWPDDKPRHVVRTTISATDADGLAEMRALKNVA